MRCNSAISAFAAGEPSAGGGGKSSAGLVDEAERKTGSAAAGPRLAKSRRAQKNAQVPSFIVLLPLRDRKSRRRPYRNAAVKPIRLETGLESHLEASLRLEVILVEAGARRDGAHAAGNARGSARKRVRRCRLVGRLDADHIAGVQRVVDSGTDLEIADLIAALDVHIAVGRKLVERAEIAGFKPFLSI